MSKDREIVCRFYQYEGSCSKGREGTFRHKCQNCNLYVPRKGAAPARKNLKKEKLAKIRNKEW